VERYRSIRGEPPQDFRQFAGRDGYDEDSGDLTGFFNRIGMNIDENAVVVALSEQAQLFK